MTYQWCIVDKTKPHPYLWLGRDKMGLSEVRMGSPADTFEVAFYGKTAAEGLANELRGSGIDGFANVTAMRVGVED